MIYTVYRKDDKINVYIPSDTDIPVDSTKQSAVTETCNLRMD